MTEPFDEVGESEAVSVVVVDIFEDWKVTIDGNCEVEGNAIDKIVNLSGR